MATTKKLTTLELKIRNARTQTENYRGVNLDVTKLKNNKEKYFRAIIVNDGHRYSLGYYDNPIEAAKAYNKKAKNLFGSEKKAKAIGRWNVIA